MEVNALDESDGSTEKNDGESDEEDIFQYT